MSNEIKYIVTANYTKDEAFKKIIESHIKNLIKKPLKYWHLSENSVKYNQSMSSY